jgi:DNA polymerase-4/DNA polymerase IV (DinB-like DNA polymerase)
MDAFFAAIEIRDNPMLAGKPLIIGSLPGERGVVSTCSYEARIFGVRSAMNIKEAFRLCPHGIYMHPSSGKYGIASRQIREIWDTYTDIIEQVSVDEGYLDVTNSAQLFGGALFIADDIKKRTLAQVGLTCSVGVGYSMMSAKIASEEKKPDGLFEIPNEAALRQLIIDRDVRIINGVGAQTAAILYKNGINTVRDIISNEQRIKDLLGEQGVHILRLCAGHDGRRLLRPTKSKSYGREHTFQKNIVDFEYLTDALRLIAKHLSFKIRKKDLYCKTVTLKITFANMKQISRSKSGKFLSTARDIFDIASSLLDKVEKRPVRLIGISLGGLTKQPAEQLSLFDDFVEDTKQEKLDKLLLNLQYKYGLDKIYTAREKLAHKRLEEFD